MRTYLDWAAAAPVHPRAARAFRQALPHSGNPASAHDEGRAARTLLETSRRTVAGFLGCRPDHLIFTSGATEANALALLGSVRAAQARGRAAHDLQVLYLPSAHASVVETMHALTKEGVRVETLPLRNGDVDIDALKSRLTNDTFLVSLDSVSPETGLRHGVRAVRQVLPPHTLLHVDASQSPLIESCEWTRFQADLLVLDAQKMGGVRGIGALAISSRAALLPLFHGGGQEGGMRSGTPSPALAAAFAAACHSCEETRTAFAARAARMRAHFCERVCGALRDVTVNEGRDQAAHIINLSFPGRDTDYVQSLLNEAGYAVGTKSACESDSDTGSRGVLALTGDADRAASTLRISFGPSTTESSLLRAASALIRAVHFLDRSRL